MVEYRALLVAYRPLLLAPMFSLECAPFRQCQCDLGTLHGRTRLGALWVDYRALLKYCRALLAECRALMVDSRAFLALLVEYMALLVDFWALLVEYCASKWVTHILYRVLLVCLFCFMYGLFW